MSKRKSNYHAARHLVEACTRRLESLGRTQHGPAAAASRAELHEELARTRRAAISNPSDASVFHARRAAMAAVMAAEADSTGSGQETTHLSLLEDELRWIEDQIRRVPWNEVLWHHRRWLLLKGVRGLARDVVSEASLRHATVVQRAAAERWSTRDVEWQERWGAGVRVSEGIGMPVVQQPARGSSLRL